MGILGETETHPIAYVNGKKLDLPLGKAEITLLQYLRGESPQLYLELHDDSSRHLVLA